MDSDRGINGGRQGDRAAAVAAVVAQCSGHRPAGKGEPTTTATLQRLLVSVPGNSGLKPVHHAFGAWSGHQTHHLKGARAHLHASE